MIYLLKMQTRVLRPSRTATSSHISPLDQVSSGPKCQDWPEEGLGSTADEGGGFYLLRLGELLKAGQFVVTRKLVWGGYQTNYPS